MEYFHWLLMYLILKFRNHHWCKKALVFPKYRFFKILFWGTFILCFHYVLWVKDGYRHLSFVFINLVASHLVEQLSMSVLRCKDINFHIKHDTWKIMHGVSFEIQWNKNVFYILWYRQQIESINLIKTTAQNFFDKI